METKNQQQIGQELDALVNSCTAEEKAFLERFSHFGGGTLRKFMSSDEIKMANRLVKKGVMGKGKHGGTMSNLSAGLTCYYVESFVLSRI